MKKILLIIVACFFVGSYAIGQEIGLRGGDIVGNKIAIDGVFAWKASRLHADVSFGDGVGIEALYDFIVKPIGGEAFNYYIGVGAYAWMGDPFQFGIAAELGLEYRFNGVPLVIGADWRPALQLVDDTDFLFDRFGVNIRWNFGD